MEGFLLCLLSLSLGGSLIAGLIFLLPKKLPSSFYYYAWLLVLLRLALPVPGMLSLPNGTAPAAEPERPAARVEIALPELPAEAAVEETAPAVPSPAPVTKTPSPAPRPSTQEPERSAPNLHWSFWVGLIWAAGFLFCFGKELMGYFRFRRTVGKTFLPPKPSDQEIYDGLAGKWQPRLCRSAAVDTPMLMGIFQPILLLPDRDYRPETLECIFRHELTHFRRLDIGYKWFAMPVLAAHWFNPLTYFIRRDIDRRCELSCDEELLAKMDHDQRKCYGETLLALAAGSRPAKSGLATSFATEKKNLKERLVHIMNFTPKGRKTILTAAILLLAVAVCCLLFGPEAGPKREGDAWVVKNVDQLLEVIDSDTKIILEPGIYDLTKANGYGRTGGDHYRWEEEFDGYQLVIRDVENLTITGRDMENCKIVTAPRYAAVLGFENARGVTLSNLTAGHTEGPGDCVGAVVQIKDSQDMLVQNAVLYGCGTRGVDGFDSQNVEVVNCDIKECSLGGTYFMGCDNVQVRECRIFDCGSEELAAYDLFSFNQCQNALVQNCEMTNNRANRLMLTMTCNAVWFVGNRVSQNELDCLFQVNGRAPMVAESSFDALPPEVFHSNFDGIDYVTSPDGGKLSARDLEAMTYQKSDFVMPKFSTPPADPQPTEDPDSIRVVEVSTLNEFLGAIGPDTTVILAEGNYDLDLKLDQQTEASRYYTWNRDYGGFQLQIRDVSNFHIIGAGKDKTFFTAKSPRVDVLWFTDCQNISVSGITAGHDTEPGNCTGSVLRFDYCQGVGVYDCGLYGCGIFGIMASEVRDLSAKNTEIYECSYGAVELMHCDNASFENCNIHDCPEPYFSGLAMCKNVTVDGELISEK